VILCAGAPPARYCLEYWLSTAELFLAADGGFHAHHKLPRRPDAVIGDFDSLVGRVIDGGGARFLHDPDQTTTDAEKALLHAIDDGCSDAVLLGAAGMRLDHTLYNCSLVEAYAGRIRVCIADEHATAVRIGPGAPVVWNLPLGAVFSLLPLAGPARVAVMAGVEWELDDPVLGNGATLSISNRIVAPPLHLGLATGSALAIVAHELHDDPGRSLL
jgi:thiamine pyrophosphokinase